METTITQCRCGNFCGHPVSIIPTTEYDYRKKDISLVYLTVCPDCRKWYDELGLILTDDQIMKFFGDSPQSV